MKLTEQFFRDVYCKCNVRNVVIRFNENFKKEHLTEILAGKVVDKIKQDVKGLENNQIPIVWNNLSGLRKNYQRDHARVNELNDKMYRVDFYGKNSDCINDKLIPPIQFLGQIVMGCADAGVSLNQIKAAMKCWFCDDGLQEMDTRVIDRAINELEKYGNLNNFWDKDFSNSLNQEKLVATKDGKMNMCYFDKGFDNKEKKPIR